MYRENVNSGFFACNPNKNIIPFNTGPSTLVRSACKHMNLIFILDFGSIFWFLETSEDSFLEKKVYEFLSVLEGILDNVSRLCEILTKEEENEVETCLKISVFFFGVYLAESWFKLVIHEVPICDLKESREEIVGYFMKEAQQALERFLNLDNKYQANPENWWGFEFLGFLGSFSASLTHSIVVITTGAISNRLFSKKSSSALICQSSYLIRFCRVSDIQIHFVVSSILGSDLEESIGMTTSLDTLRFISDSTGGSVIECEQGIDEAEGKNLVLDLVLRSTGRDPCFRDSFDLEKELKGLKEIKSYKVSRKVSILDLLVGRLKEGFGFVHEPKIHPPLVLVSRFHKLVEVICVISNSLEPAGQCGDFFWLVRFFLKDPEELITSRGYLEQPDDLLEFGSETNKKESINKRHSLAKKLSRFILDLNLLDCWLESLVVNTLGNGGVCPAFPRELENLLLPSTINHGLDLVLESNKNLLEDTFDGFRSSWDQLQTKITELGFKKLEAESKLEGEEALQIYFSHSTDDKNLDLGVWQVLRSWGAGDFRGSLSNFGKGYQQSNISICWLKLQRISIKCSTSTLGVRKEQENYSSIVRTELLFYGFSPKYCQEYLDSFRERLGEIGISSGIDLGLLKTSMGLNSNFECGLDGKGNLGKSWNYVLLGNDNRSSSYAERGTLNERVIMTIANSRALDGWNLLSRKNNGRGLSSSWFKLVDSWTGNCSKLRLAFIYEVSFQYGDNLHESRLTCRLSLMSSMGNLGLETETGEKKGFSFTEFSDFIQCQDNQIIQVTSLIEYLYTSSQLRKEVEYSKGFGGEMNKDKRSSLAQKKLEKSLNSRRNGKSEATALRLSEFSDGYRKKKELCKYERIIQHGSFYGSKDKVSLTIREISILFFTFNNNEREQNSNENLPELPVLGREEVDRDFIKQFKPLCIIEIPLVKTEIPGLSTFGQITRNRDSEDDQKKKYFESASESSFEKFLFKLSKIADRSVRVDENEWYMILFIDKNDLAEISELSWRQETANLSSNQNSLNEKNPNTFSENKNGKKLYKNFQACNYMIITRVILLRSVSKAPIYSLLEVYLCSFYNLSFGITSKRRMRGTEGMEERRDLTKVEQYVELYILRLKDIWYSIKFRMISKYYLLGVPIYSRDIARIQREFYEETEQVLCLEEEGSGFEFGEKLGTLGSDPLDSLDLSVKLNEMGNCGFQQEEGLQRLLSEFVPERGNQSTPGNPSDSRALNTEQIRREVCGFLKCSIYRLYLRLPRIQRIVLQKFGQDLGDPENDILDYLERVAGFMKEELEQRMKSVLKMKLVSFECPNLSNFLVFCGALELGKVKSENIIVAISLLRSGQNLEVPGSGVENFWNRFGRLPDSKFSWFNNLIWRSMEDEENLELKVRHGAERSDEA
ncbi:hypothetical protein HWI79_2457 [Cryptosporidium felis]|nr:hypothetical protein HWI79_2457 [Cryptosporidium felis]